VIVTVDIKRFPRDEPRRIMCKKGGGHAHVVNAYIKFGNP
jgi:hypothetical protein